MTGEKTPQKYSLRLPFTCNTVINHDRVFFEYFPIEYFCIFYE